MSAVRVVCFDIDDTLFLERDYVRSGFAAAGAYVRDHDGPDDFAERAWSMFEAGRRGDIFDAVLAGYGRAFDPDLVARLVGVYRSHAPSIALLEDARALIERLHSAVALAAISDGPLESQAAKAAALTLDTWMDPVVLTAALGEGMGKPQPRAFEIVEERTGAPGSACAYIADNPAKDFAGPLARGWRVLRVRRPGGLHAGIEAPGIPTISDLRNAEDQLGITALVEERR